MEIKKHLEMLGLEVEDRITRFSGIVSSISFDLYGCVQGLITQSIDDDGKIRASRWFDMRRLKVKSKDPVMERPNFYYGDIAKGKQGVELKPIKI